MAADVNSNGTLNKNQFCTFFGIKDIKTQSKVTNLYII
jgi:hypothetical protein